MSARKQSVLFTDAYGVWLYDKFGDAGIHRVDFTVRSSVYKNSLTAVTPATATVRRWLKEWSVFMTRERVPHVVFFEGGTSDGTTDEYRWARASNRDPGKWELNKERPHGHAVFYAQENSNNLGWRTDCVDCLGRASHSSWTHGNIVYRKVDTPLMTYRYISKQGDLIEAWFGDTSQEQRLDMAADMGQHWLDVTGRRHLGSQRGMHHGSPGMVTAPIKRMATAAEVTPPIDLFEGDINLPSS